MQNFGIQALTLDCGNHWPGGPVNQKIHWPPKKPTGPPKICNDGGYDPNVFAAGIYDFTREVAHFCTLGLSKNKYELTLPSKFCRFPVKILAAYEVLKKKKINWPLGPVENKLWWPELARQSQKGMRASGHIANVKAWHTITTIIRGSPTHTTQIIYGAELAHRYLPLLQLFHRSPRVCIMPTTCGFPNCKFRSRYRASDDNRHFYRVPKKPTVLRDRWLEAIGRTEETIINQVGRLLVFFC